MIHNNSKSSKTRKFKKDFIESILDLDPKYVDRIDGKFWEELSDSDFVREEEYARRVNSRKSQ